MEGRVALAKDRHSRIEVIRILEWHEDTAVVGTFADSSFKLIPLEDSKKSKRTISADKITFFGRPVDLSIDSTVVCILINDELISTGYVERRDQYPKVTDFLAYGSGVRGINVKREHAIPNQVEIDPGNFYYVKDPLAKEFITLVSQRTNQYLWEYMHSHTHNMEQLHLLTVGWRLVFHLDHYCSAGSPGEPGSSGESSPRDEPVEEITSGFMRGIIEDWEKLHRDSSLNVDEVWAGFDNFPNLILPSLTTVIMFFQGYNSLISYDKHSVIYPPYAADIKYLTM